ncbi:3-oxoacyl-[acyl-carrier-protein] reductase [Thermodesulforhabdus norvegica]|uniref:3-oxoacyl-[acyl-carrier-protein] reductase n=1 Tax=Thermodesulforhabdus norvegica TaxID=39841 RepID=A0A1I4SXI2_9BACT|nr:3-oxoacyl-[acyl-carrier-protein] reductase [Thermodesulforhabdus norvegica]SFM69164.1 3-oxoacyl-[acyl-carrier-protein] reductase [Thermodesulforhabdus norvegica]
MSETRVAVVTGGSRGIGRAVALGLAKAGMDVVINFRSNKDRAKEVAGEIEKIGRKAYLFPFDVSKEEEVKEGFRAILEQCGRVDVLVNNAGITADNLTVLMKPDEWHAVIRTNLNSVFFCSQAVIKPMLRKKWGRIINITSVIGFIGNAGQANYAAAKAGIVGFTKSLARELASRNITVNAVAPGYIETDMTAELPDDMKKNLLSQIPMGRTGTPEDVAAAVRFLASDEAAYITGQVIHVNGGMFM